MFKNIKILFSGNILTAILNFFNFAFLLKIIGIENNGILFLGQSYMEFFNTFLNFQTYDAVIKFFPLAKNKKEEKNYIYQALILDIITAVLAFIVANLLLKTVSVYLDWNLKIYQIVKIMMYGLLFNIVGIFNGIYRITNSFKILATLTFLKSFLVTISYLVGFYLKLSIFYYAYTYVVIIIIIFFINTYFFINILKKIEINILKFDKIYLDKQFIKFNIYTNLSTTLDLPVFQLVPFIINKYLGVSDVAIYKILEKIGSIYTLFSGTLSNALAPEISKFISKKDIIKIRDLQKKLQKYILGFGILTIIIIFLTKQIWLKYLIPNYTEYMSSIYFYFVYLVFTSLFILYHYIFIYSGFEKYNIYILLIVNSIYLLLLIIFAKKYGINGVILSKFLQAAIIYLCKYRFFKKKLFI